MDRIPLGIPQFDATIGGGAPAGSVVLLAGESGAGARECCYTSTVMNGLGHADEHLFDLYYGDVPPAGRLPEEIHYVSFTTEPAAIEAEMRYVLADDLVDAGLEAVQFYDLSREYFQLTPVPTDWYRNEPTDITDLGSRHERRDVLEALGDYLSEHAADNLVVIDSVNDLLAASGADFDRGDLTALVKGLARASYRWNGIVLLLATVEPLTDRQLGRLTEATDGTLTFEWESGGSDRARTLVVDHFRGVLSRLAEENIVRFETEIGDAGFDVSNVRKIR